MQYYRKINKYVIDCEVFFQFKPYEYWQDTPRGEIEDSSLIYKLAFIDVLLPAWVLGGDDDARTVLRVEDMNPNSYVDVAQ